MPRFTVVSTKAAEEEAPRGNKTKQSFLAVSVQVEIDKHGLDQVGEKDQ